MIITSMLTTGTAGTRLERRTDEQFMPEYDRFLHFILSHHISRVSQQTINCKKRPTPIQAFEHPSPKKKQKHIWLRIKNVERTIQLRS